VENGETVTDSQRKTQLLDSRIAYEYHRYYIDTSQTPEGDTQMSTQLTDSKKQSKGNDSKVQQFRTTNTTLAPTSRKLPRTASGETPAATQRSSSRFDVLGGADKIDFDVLGGADKMDYDVVGGADKIDFDVLGGADKMDYDVLGGADKMDYDVVGYQR
jgi:hypothetical protein